MKPTDFSDPWLFICQAYSSLSKDSSLTTIGYIHIPPRIHNNNIGHPAMFRLVPPLGQYLFVFSLSSKTCKTNGVTSIKPINSLTELLSVNLQTAVYAVISTPKTFCLFSLRC